MKRLFLKVVFLILIVFFNGTAWTTTVEAANEIEELNKQIQQLRQDYESKIQNLQAQIDNLSKSQQEKVTQIEEKIEKKLITTEYVGRYEGPFGKGGLLIKNPSGFGNVSMGGYADIEFENFENSNSTFDQARFILNLGAQPHERLLFYSEYEIEHGGPNASDLGEAKVEQAWISYLINDWINLRGGIVLIPFGKFNLLHDSDIQDLTERPIVSRRLAAATWMEAGIGAFGELNIGEALNWSILPDSYLNYEGYIVNGLDEDISDVGITKNAKGAIESDTNNNKAFVGRVGLGLNRNLEIGLNSYFGRYGRSGAATSNGKDNLIGLGADLNFKRGPFELVGDFLYWDFEDGALVDDDNTDSSAAVSAPEYMRGFYIEPRFHFWPKFLNNTFLGRGFKDPKLTFVSRYDWVDIGDDGDAGNSENKESRFALGLNYRPIESWVFKLEYQWNTSENEVLERGDKNGVMASMAIGF